MDSFYGRLLFCLFSILSVVLCVPDLGIQRDWLTQFGENDLESYSGVIKFDDTSIPHDPSKLSNAQFINLAKVAYDKMVSSCSDPFKCPGAMIAMEADGSVYFASSVRKNDNVDLGNIDENIYWSVGWFMKQCADEGMGTHRLGGACAEPNVLRLYGDVMGPTNDSPPQYKKPPANSRIAVWGRPSGALPNQDRETYFSPCKDSPGASSDYGCIRLVGVFNLKEVGKADPDPNGQDDWKYSHPGNPRRSCS